MQSDMSRRQFGGALGAAALFNAVAAPALARAQPLRAADVIERIKGKLASEGVAWRAETVDTIKIGRQETPITGIATTFQATFDVLKRAAAARTNLIVSHERLFWDFLDEVGPLAEDAASRQAGTLESDPVMIAKRRFCEEHGLVVLRFHDHWHAHRPEPIFAGLTAQLGWQSYARSDGLPPMADAYHLPETPLGAVARHVRAKLGTRDVRVIGDPATPVRHIIPTAHNLREMHPALQGADVVLVGETEEFDVFHYMRDAISLGLPRPKGLIVISHERMEEPGMELAGEWLRPLVPGMPVRFLPSGNPYWVAS
jgi:putative NIF3 family GTP cyclohydrolase 1 type 2